MAGKPARQDFKPARLGLGVSASAPWAAAMACVVLALTLSGCMQGTVPPRDAQGRYVIHATGANTFTPADARVPRGATVVWVVDAGAHDVNADDESFSSTADAPKDAQGYPLLLTAGQSYAHTFNETGSWVYWCHTHHSLGMKGVIRVT
jgi:plastocyanin